MASTKVFAENIVDMKNHADDARTALLDMEAIMDNWIETLTNGMKDIWESDEYDKFRKDFEGDMAERKKAFDAMRRLLSAVDAGMSGSVAAFSYAARYRCMPSTKSPAAHASAALCR